MRVLIVSQYFYPENFKVNDIAFELKKRGNEVTVLTAKPNYPKGKFYKGYNFLNRRREVINGVEILRVPIFPRFNGSGKYLILNYISFLFFSFFAVHLRLKNEYDVVFSHHPSPLTSALPAVWLKKKFKIPYACWVLDLWPESVIANSRINGGVLIRQLTKVVQYIYNNSDKILVSSNSFKSSIIHNFQVQKTKIDYFPNWAEDVFTNTSADVHSLPDLPSGFNVVFAGNIGESQDFESVLKAAEHTKEQINWVFIGDGRKVAWVKEQKKIRQLENIHLLGSFALETMPTFFKKADAMLVSLKNNPTFKKTIPAKIQAYMSTGSIILGMLSGEGKDLINQSGSGFAVDAGEYLGLAKNALKVKGLPMIEQQQIKKASKKYYSENFSKKILLDNLENTLKQL